MYATVYGLTKVVHVGHPVPAREILNGMGRSDDVSDTWDVGSRLLSIQREILQSLFGTGDAKFEAKRTQMKRQSSSYTNTTGSTKNPAYDHFKNFSGDGVFTANGADWKAKRSSVLHCLLGNINELENEVNKSADELLDELNKMSATEEAFNVVPLLQRCTIGLIYRVITHDHDAFGLDSNGTFKDKDYIVGGNQCAESATTTSPRCSATSLTSMEALSESVLDTETVSKSSENYNSNQAKQRRSNPLKSLLPTYLESVTQIRMIILAQSRSIWYLLPRWMYRLISPMYREEERVMGPIREFARLTCQNAKKGSPLDLLSKRASHKNHTMREMDTSKDMLDEAITLLFAGQDTSAATLSWTLHLLSLDPVRQKKLVEEVRSVLRNNSSDSELDFVSKSMIAEMPYLDAVIKESMRLYPVAPFVVRKLTTSITIPCENPKATSATHTILPSSTFACIWIYALHRNPKLWHLPDDFVPERWIDPQLRVKDSGQDEPGAYIPFAMGPRNCLGRPLAQVILRVLLARILNRYTVVDPRWEALRKRQTCNANDIESKCLRKDMQAGFTVLPSNGLMLQLVERRNNNTK